MAHTRELVDSLRKQYTLNNDGGGLDGRCRVSNKDLLELLRLVEQTEQQNAELLAALIWISVESESTAMVISRTRISMAAKEAIAKAGK